MLKIKQTKKEDLKFLYIEIDYIENLQNFGHLINDFVFNLCILRFYQFEDEPFFLPEGVEILIEVSPYIKNLLYRNIDNLQLFREEKMNFDLKRLNLSKHCDFAEDIKIISIFLDNVIENKIHTEISFNPTTYLGTLN